GPRRTGWRARAAARRRRGSGRGWSWGTLLGLVAVAGVLGAAAGPRQKDVVQARLAHRQGGRGEVMVVKGAQYADQHPRAVLGGQAQGGRPPLGPRRQADRQQVKGAGGAGPV